MEDEKKAREDVEFVIALKEVFDTEKGKDVLYRLCKVFHYFQSSYVGDVNDCIFREGERNVINYIMTHLQKEPKKLFDEFRRRLREDFDYE